MEHHEGLGLVFRVLAWGIAAWTLFLVFRNMLRHVGVVPWPPFKTREEYLAAAVDMDLDEFIERAKVTPREVIAVQKIRPAGIITEKSPDGYSPVAGSAFLSLVGTVSEIMSKKEHELSKAKELSERFPVGRWFRIKTGYRIPAPGGLVMVVRVWEDVVTCAYAGGVTTFPPEALEQPYPRADEWWEFLGHKGSEGGRFSSDGTHSPLKVFKYSERGLSLDETLYLKCGCFVPVNFGHGEKNQA